MQAALDTPLTEKLLLDKNPSLLPLVPVFKRLWPAQPRDRLPRDPRDVLVSCLLTHFPLNDFSVDFLSVDAGAARIATDLQLWLVLRDRLSSAWTEVKDEYVVKDFATVLERLLCDLGRPWQDAVLHYRDHQTAGLGHSPSYDTVRQPIYTESVHRWRNYARYLEPVLPRLTPLVEGLGYDG